MAELIRHLASRALTDAAILAALVFASAVLFMSVIFGKLNEMNQQEIEAFDALSKRIEALATVADNFRTDNNALKAEVESLKAQLAAVPVAVDDSADVLAAIKADDDKIDAELAK